MANLVWTEDGLDWLKSRAFNPATAEAAALAIAIGSGSATPAATDAALGAETARAALTYTAVGVGTFKLSRTFAAGVGTGSVAEVGLFDNTTAVSGTLLARALVSPFTKGAGDSYTVELPIDLTDVLA